MRKFSLSFRLSCLILLLATLAGCAAPPQPAATQPAPERASVGQGQPVSTATGINQALATQPGGQPTPAVSPTPDLRLPPEQWQEWPVVPAATGRAIDIYRLGQTLGNDPRHFSKIGDCQSIKEALMGMFDRPGYYRLEAGEEYLEEAIAQFAGSFNRDGNAVQGGFNAASVLSPMWANPDTCKAGENPLECEYRVHKPAFALISLEVWWNGRTPERYEQYMRRIIEYAMAHGVVPVLSTKADNVEGDNSINLATARLAYEYDLPLWNWWRAAQDLPNGGLDPTRPDLFHLSDEAWTPRSKTALMALDSVWRGVQNGKTGAGQAQPVPMPTGTEQAQPLLAQPTAPAVAAFATPTPGDAPVGGASGRVLVSLAERKDEALRPLGIYRLDIHSGEKTLLLGDGARLQAQAADGRLLFSRGSDLYTAAADGSGTVKIAGNLSGSEQIAALWLAGGGAAYLADLPGGQSGVVYDALDGSGWKRLTGAADRPQELFPSPSGEQVFWADAQGRVFASGLDASTAPLKDVRGPVFSPRAPDLVYKRVLSEERNLLVLGKADGSGQREAPLPGDYVLDAAWSPDGTRLSVLLLNRSEYSGRWGGINHFLFTPADFGTRELPRASGLNPRSVWSPDGKYLLLAGTDPLEQGYRVYLRAIDASTLKSIELTLPLDAQSPDLLLVTGLGWE